MFAPIDVPDEVAELHVQTVLLAEKMAPGLQGLGESRDFLAGVDLLREAEPGVLRIDDGYLKLSHGGRTVRFYRDGDLVMIGSAQPARAKLTGELMTRTTWIGAERLTRALSADPTLLSQWTAYQDAQLQLMTAICALYAAEDHRLGIKLEKRGVGSVLIRQGEPLREVFVMVDGAADVLVDGINVGRVIAGEFIGEMSFLTETNCGATVVASEDCMVQVIDRDSFAAVIRSRPQTMFVLARTLAERLVRANLASVAGVRP